MVYEKGDLIGKVFTLSEIQRLVLRLLIHRGEPLPTGQIRFGLASYLYNVYSEKKEDSWKPESYEEAKKTLKNLNEYSNHRAVPSFNGLETQLAMLEAKGFIIKQDTKVKVGKEKTTKNAQRAKALWSLNPNFVSEYFEKKADIRHHNYHIFPRSIIEFFEFVPINQQER